MLVLFSDGVTDAVDESDQEFGEERLLDALRLSAGLPLTDIAPLRWRRSTASPEARRSSTTSRC